MMESMEALATMFMHCTSIVYLNSTMTYMWLSSLDMKLHVYFTLALDTFLCIIGNPCSLRLQEWSCT